MMAGFLDPKMLQGGLWDGSPAAGLLPGSQAPAPTGQGVLNSLFAPAEPHELSKSDRWNLVGATLRDIGSSLAGKSGDEVNAVQKTQDAINGPAVGGRAGSGTTGRRGGTAPADRAAMYSLAKVLYPDDVQAQLRFTIGDPDFLKATAEAKYGFHAVAPGDTILNGPADSPSMAPKLVDHDGQYGTQTADGYTATGAAPASYADQTAQRNSATEASRAMEAARHNHVDEGQGAQRIGLEGRSVGIAGAHLGLDRQQFGLALQKFGHELNPMAPVISNKADHAALPVGTTYVAPDGHVRTKKR